jgi:CheY-like chemotaxis protein
MRVGVLVVHVALANRIGEGLRDAGFAVDVVYDGAAALQSTASTGYDVVVLDRDRPAVYGERVCRRLVRDGSPSRILMLTAATGVEDRVDGLELAARSAASIMDGAGSMPASSVACGHRTASNRSRYPVPQPTSRTRRGVVCTGTASSAARSAMPWCNWPRQPCP